MFLQKFSALSNEKHYLHGDLPRMGKNQDVLHPELCSLRKGHLLIVSPSPVPCPCWRGHRGSTTVMWCVGARPGCSQTSPQIQQNLLSPPVPLPWPFYGHPSGDFAVIEENRSFSCPSHTAAVQAPSEWDIMPWLLFTAIKLCWQLHKFFPWGMLHLLASNRQNLVCFQSILEGFIRHHKHAPKSDTMVSSGKVSNLMET